MRATVVFAAVNRGWKLEQFVGSVLTLFLPPFHSSRTGAKMFVTEYIITSFDVIHHCNFFYLRSKL